MNLFEMTVALRNVLENGIVIDSEDVMTEDGELFSAEELEALNIERDEKIEGIALFIKELDAESSALKEEEKKLKARREAKENKAKWLKSYLLGNLNGQKFETSRVAISYRKSTQVVIQNEEAVPSEFLKTKTSVEVDKTALKKVLATGFEIEGCSLEEKQNIQIK